MTQTSKLQTQIFLTHSTGVIAIITAIGFFASFLYEFGFYRALGIPIDYYEFSFSSLLISLIYILFALVPAYVVYAIDLGRKEAHRMRERQIGLDSVVLDAIHKIGVRRLRHIIVSIAIILNVLLPVSIGYHDGLRPSRFQAASASKDTVLRRSGNFFIVTRQSRDDFMKHPELRIVPIDYYKEEVLIFKEW